MWLNVKNMYFLYGFNRSQAAATPLHERCQLRLFCLQKKYHLGKVTENGIRRLIGNVVFYGYGGNNYIRSRSALISLGRLK